MDCETRFAVQVHATYYTYDWNVAVIKNWCTVSCTAETRSYPKTVITRSEVCDEAISSARILGFFSIDMCDVAFLRF